MLSEGNSLLKVGVIMMAVALALVVVAVMVIATLSSEPERVAAEVATQSPGEGPRYSSGEEGSATTKSSSEKESARHLSGEEALGYGSSSSSEKESARHLSGEEALGYGSSSSGESVGQRKEDTKEPQAVVQQEAEPPNSQSAMPQLAGNQTEQLLPGSEQRDWSEPTRRELQAANAERHYELLPGAIMGLTIEAIGVYDAPVFDSDAQWALASGVAHHPQTSLPWSQSAQRNVYLAGHRMGYRGTWSRMIFYNLDKLERGDEILLKDRTGRSYRYRVSEVFLTDPKDVWVMGQVRGRDMVTLQTCTPYPTFEKRLIVRADRV